jgi:hypothetical protein
MCSLPEHMGARANELVTAGRVVEKERMKRAAVHVHVSNAKEHFETSAGINTCTHQVVHTQARQADLCSCSKFKVVITSDDARVRRHFAEGSGWVKHHFSFFLNCTFRR